MEAGQQTPAWLDPGHPNFERWKRGRERSRKRAEVVRRIISSAAVCENLEILDFGSGEGGTSVLFSEKNNVISCDLSLIRLQRQKSFYQSYSLVNAISGRLPFISSSFDLIILQDVIEHITDREVFVTELKRVLRDDGLIYLSTPNKYSVVNILADPHWGIPLLALFRRPAIKKYFLRYFRKGDLHRKDIAQLMSLKEATNLFSGFKISLKTQKAVEILSESFDGMLWSDFHLLLYASLKITGLISLLKVLASDRKGIVNNFFTPVFFAVLKKIPSN